MKKLFAAIILIILALLSVSCGYKSGTDKTNTDNTDKISTADGHTAVTEESDMKNENLFDSLKIDGRDIAEFRLIGVGNITDNTEIFSEIERVLGRKFARADAKSNGAHYIIYDDTSLIANGFEIKVDNGDLVIFGSYNTIAEAGKYFTETFLPSLSAKSRDYNITSADNVKIETEKKSVYTKEELYKVLEYVYNDDEHFIFGQEIGKSPESPSTVIEDFYGASGKKPSIIGADLACYGYKLRENSENRSYWSKLICEYVDYAAQGGIITLSSHFRNPTGNYENEWANVRGNLGREEAWEKLLTEGSEYNVPFKEELALDGEFLAALRDNGVPVIWRPLHEMNGGFFWYGIMQDGGYTLDASYFVRLWKYIYTYYTDELGLDNLIWEYSPNLSNGNYADTMYCYVGDDYCDLVSLDWYTSGNYEIGGSGKSYEKIMKTGKISSLSEFGIQKELVAEDPEYQDRIFSAMNILDNAEKMIDDGYKISYILTWNAKDSIRKLKKGDKLMATGKMLSLDDMPTVFDKLR